jgi:hypothetical protein
MATINKDFKIKQGLVVEGSTGTIAGNDILTKSSADQEYIIDIAGGGGESNNIANAIVKRDGSGNFAAGVITADLTGDVTGTVSSLSNHDTDDLTEGSNQYFTDARAKDSAASLLTNATLSNITITGSGSGLTITAENGIADSDTDDLDEGSNHLYFTEERVKNVLTGSTQTNIVIQEIAGELHITAENGVADSTTDDLTEGSTNKYFTDQRAQDALAGMYDPAGSASSAQTAAQNYADSAAANAQAAAEDYVDSLASDYDPAGSAANALTSAQAYASSVASSEAGTVQTNLNNHESDTSTHGVTGDIVGTSDTQTLTNKTIGDVLTFNDGSNNSTIDVNGNNLSISASADLTLSTSTGDIVLNPDNFAYIGSASDGNKIATNSYVDNAVSGLNWKQAVNLLAHTSISLTGNATTTSIDGHSLGDADGYRVLLTGQSTDSENGIYDVDVSAGTYTFTRSTDADTYTELVGAAVFVMEGTTYGQTSWVQSDHYITDFTSQEWTQFSGSGSVVAGTGITVDGLEVSVDRTTVDSWYDASGSAANALADAQTYASSVASSEASTAYSNATSYADGLAINYDASGAAANAYSNAVSYADGLASDYDAVGSAANAYSNATSYADSAAGNAYANATAYADGLASNYDASGAAANAYSNAVAYADALDTDDIAEGSVNHYYTDGRAKTAAANLLTNSILSNITITGDGDGLVITAENGVAGSDTDDLAEGTNNLYFTEARAQAAVAGDISSAINALDTDDIEEGTSNLYFTNNRAQSAVASDISSAISNGDSGASPTYQEINFTWATKQIGTYTWIPNSGSTTVYTWNANSYPAAKFLVRVRAGQDSQVSEVLVTKDDNGNVAITEYAMVYTNGVLGDVTASYSNGTYTLTVNATNNSTEAVVSGTLLAYGD